MKVAVPLAKDAFATLGITPAASALDRNTKKNTWICDNKFNNF